MPSSFSITTSTESITLQQRQGEATFTVTNISGRLRSGRARLVPWDPEAAGWLTLVGAAERSFEAGESRQYTVQVAVPDEAPSGRHFFRLDMMSGETADDDYVEGPTVTLRTNEDRFFPWWLVGTTAVLLILAVMASWWANRQTELVAVPDVAQLAEADARSTLEAAGFTVGVATQEADTETNASRVLRTRPMAGQTLPAGETVGLVLSSGPPEATVPEIAVGVTVDEARQQLAAAEIDVVDELLREETADVPAGHVVRTEPAAGSTVAPDTPVQLVVAVAPATFDLVLTEVGERPRQVTEALQQQLALAPGEAAALAAGAPSLLGTGWAEAEAASLVAHFTDLGAVVEMRASAGDTSIAVPRLDDLPQEEALAAFRAACEPSPCLNGAVLVRESDQAPPGYVLESRPDAGAELSRGEIVTLIIAGAPTMTSDRGRLTVSDVYPIAGHGTVLTGRVEQGTFRQGAAVLIRTAAGDEATRGSIVLITLGKESRAAAATGDEVGLLLPDAAVAGVTKGYIVEAIE